MFKYTKGGAQDPSCQSAAGKERNVEYRIKHYQKYPMAAKGEGRDGYAIFTVREAQTRSSL